MTIALIPNYNQQSALTSYSLLTDAPAYKGTAPGDLTPAFSNPASLIFADKDRALDYLSLTHDLDLPAYLTHIQWPSHYNEPIHIHYRPFFKPDMPTDCLLAHLSTNPRALFLSQSEAANHCRNNASLCINTKMDGSFYVVRYDPIGIKRKHKRGLLRNKAKLKSTIDSGNFELGNMSSLLYDLVCAWDRNESHSPLALDTGYYSYPTPGGWGRKGHSTSDCRTSMMKMLRRFHDARLVLRWPTVRFIPGPDDYDSFLDSYISLRPYLNYWSTHGWSPTIHFLRRLASLTRIAQRKHAILSKRRATIAAKKAKRQATLAQRRINRQYKIDLAAGHTGHEYTCPFGVAAWRPGTLCNCTRCVTLRTRNPVSHVPQAVADATANLQGVPT